jgi:hypothetical protein
MWIIARVPGEVAYLSMDRGVPFIEASPGQGGPSAGRGRNPDGADGPSLESLLGRKDLSDDVAPTGCTQVVHSVDKMIDQSMQGPRAL